MSDIVFMQIGDALNDLFENKLGILFIKFPSFSYIIKQVSPWTQFHNYHMMAIGLKCFKNLYIVGMS